MKKTVVILIHGGYWLIYLLLLAVIFAIAQTQIRKTPPDLLALLPLLVLCVAPNLISFYSFYFPLFSRFLVRRKIFAVILFGAAVCLGAAFSGALFSLVFFGFEQAIFTDAGEFLSLAASLFVIAAIHGGIALVIRGFVTWYGEIKLKEELYQKNYEMEQALISSQMNPHFLFNTLNNIDVLIARDAARASVYLNKLSDILRYMVYETKTDRILLEKELNYLEKYLELQKIRTTNPDYVSFQVTGEAGNLMIAPMIFFPFIENAFKHTEHKKSSSSITIEVLINREKIAFECQNTHQNSSPIKPDYGGLGNELIRKRLMLLYPDRHSLEIEKGEQLYRVKLSLDLDED